MLPIAQRELQVAARSPRFYKWRLRLGVLVLLISIGISLSSAGGLQRGAAGSAFGILCFLGLLACLLEGLRNTADCISEEKRDGTLGLLFLTDLKGFDIILGKLVGAIIRSFSALLSFVPVLAITLLLGGTTGGEFWRMVLVLCFTLLFSLSFCLMISTFSRDKSISVSGWLLSILVLLPLAVGGGFPWPVEEWVLAASPFYLLNAGSDAHFSRNPGPYFGGIAWLFTLSTVSLLVASLAIPHAWHDKPLRKIRRKRMGGQLSPPRAARRRAMLDRNPAMWLMTDPASQRNFRIFIAFVGVCAIVSFGSGIFLDDQMRRALFLGTGSMGAVAITLGTSLHVARESSRNLAEARENGALELILSTPVKVRDIIKGQWLALRGDLIPALVVFLALFAFTLIHAFDVQGGFENLFLFKLGAEAVAGVITLGWVGMWMALTSKTPGRAFFKTILFGLILPHLVCTPTLVNQLILLLVAADKLQVQFRRFVAERYLQQTGFSLAPVGHAASNAPPVIR